MANKIKLKRGLSTNIPSLTLEQGEIALTTDTNEILSINKDGVIESITPHLLNSANKIKSELIDFPTSVSGNAGSANKVNNSLTLTKNGINTTFNGSAAKTIQIPTIHYGVGTPESTLGQDGDIYIVIVPATISFTIGGDSYTALEGMTWQQWVDSDYNIIEAFVSEYSDGNRIEYIDGSKGRYICEYRTPTDKFAYADEIIIGNYDYDDSYKYPV